MWISKKAHLCVIRGSILAAEARFAQPLPQGLVLIQNRGSEKPLAKAAKMAPKIREDFVT